MIPTIETSGWHRRARSLGRGEICWRINEFDEPIGLLVLEDLV